MKISKLVHDGYEPEGTGAGLEELMRTLEKTFMLGSSSTIGKTTSSAWITCRRHRPARLRAEGSAD